jgi:hypothetical protein
MHKIHISGDWETSDDHREHATIIHGLAPEIEALEEKITELTKAKVRIEIKAKRVKAPNDTVKPVVAVEAAVEEAQPIRSYGALPPPIPPRRPEPAAARDGAAG